MPLDEGEFRPKLRGGFGAGEVEVAGEDVIEVAKRRFDYKDDEEKEKLGRLCGG